MQLITYSKVQFPDWDVRFTKILRMENYSKMFVDFNNPIGRLFANDLKRYKKVVITLSILTLHFFAVWLRQRHQNFFSSGRSPLLNYWWKATVEGEWRGHSHFWYDWLHIPASHKAFVIDLAMLYEIHARGFSRSFKTNSLDQCFAGFEQSFDDSQAIYEDKG